MENSTRFIRHNVLEKMRNIINPNALIDEADEDDPYSLKFIAQNFQEADAVVYVDVKSFREIENAFLDKFALKANVKEVFKGTFKAGASFEYRDDLLYRPMRAEDLGEQILYLKKNEENGKIYYERVDYTEGWIQYGILEKLRKIKREKSNKKK